MAYEPGGSMPHSQGFSNNSYPEPNKPNYPNWYRILKALLPSSILVTCPAHLNILHLITLTKLGEWYKLCSSWLWSLLHSPFSSHLGPNIRLRILFSNTLSLDSSLNVRDYVSQPYITTGNIIVLYILIFKFFERNREDKSLWTE